ncbi:MAG TPA: maleylpyruvate isomerase family mycothiol-dependent enzyme [Streptosporangiaceae bacterium]|jgi:uncharacterized protein (TIGR03083 family)
MPFDLDFHDHLARESARFAEAIGQAAPSARVPSCPDWTADDLLWHLTEVQFFWLTVVKEKLDRAEAEKRKPQRPADRAGLLDLYRRASRELGVTLALSSPDTPVWTWSSDRTVGFVLRRQAHEALIHRVDAELTAGLRTPIDTALADDGVAEALGVMYGYTPEWGSFTPDADRTVRFRADDTGGSWLVALGRFTGTDPAGKSYDEPDIHLADVGSGSGSGSGPDTGGAASAEIHGSAGDLDCWLWHRPALGPVERSGDSAVLAALDAAIAPGIS